MCVSPIHLPDGVVAACRKCLQCRSNRILDWAGRCIAESKVARATNSITLTYGRDRRNGAVDHVRVAVLTYSDVQKYFKLLRRHGYPCRYFAVGEYGAEKGRSHWHIIIFWQDKVPPHKMHERHMQQHWPHGWSYWQPCNYKSVRYVCKYLTKDMGDDGQYHLAMSKKPPLGEMWFRRLAEQYVSNGLAPQNLRYEHSECLDREGQKVKFYMHGKTADTFLEHYVTTWEEQRPSEWIPNSDLVEEWQDRQLPERVELLLEPRRLAVRAPVDSDRLWWMKSDNIGWSEVHNAYYYQHGPYGTWWWCLDDEGKPRWQSVLGGTKKAPSTGYQGATRGL